jgi:hypothetical protein
VLQLKTEVNQLSSALLSELTQATASPGRTVSAERRENQHSVESKDEVDGNDSVCSDPLGECSLGFHLSQLS